jgi:hypothetical protein
MVGFSMLSIYRVKRGFNYLPPFPLTTFIWIEKNLTPIIVLDELMAPSSQFWFLEDMHLFLYDQPGHLSLLCRSFPSPHMTSGHDLMHPPYEILGFHLSGVFTPLDFKYIDVRFREMTHLDQWSDFH